MSKTPLLYALHSGNLYGTERMALATAEGLSASYDPVIFAPPGPALNEAKRMGFQARPFNGARDFAWAIRPFLAGNRQAAFMATGVMHSLALLGWNCLYRRRVAHLHMVHGGTDEALSYGRKKTLNNRNVTFVAVSSFVSERLAANGVRREQVEVIENFLPDNRVLTAPRRDPFEQVGVRRAVVISRVDPIKRVDLLLDALDREPSLEPLQIRVLGAGWDLERLRERAQRKNPNVEFAGFREDVASELAASDMLIHLCPAEPFGLAILEAMAAGVPVLVPNRGGAGSLVTNGVSGFHFEADDAGDLARQLVSLRNAAPERLNSVVQGGFASLASRFSASARLADYARLLQRGLA